MNFKAKMKRQIICEDAFVSAPLEDLAQLTRNINKIIDAHVIAVVNADPADARATLITLRKNISDSQSGTIINDGQGCKLLLFSVTAMNNVKFRIVFIVVFVFFFTAISTVIEKLTARVESLAKEGPTFENTRLDRLCVDHLLRYGHYATAKLIYTESGYKIDFDYLLLHNNGQDFL
jgi:hypothetical protein